jgi:hypothetical protein
MEVRSNSNASPGCIVDQWAERQGFSEDYKMMMKIKIKAVAGEV